MKKRNIAFNILFSISTFMSVYAYALLSKLTGDPSVKIQADVLITVLLVVLNTAVLVLYNKSKKNN